MYQADRQARMSSNATSEFKHCTSRQYPSTPLVLTSTLHSEVVSGITKVEDEVAQANLSIRC